MIRYYCDGCGEELTQPGDLAYDKWFQSTVAAGDAFPNATIRVRTVVDVNGTSNAGTVCLDCVKQVVAEGYFGRDSAVEGATK